MTRPVSSPPAPRTQGTTLPAPSRHSATQAATGGNGALAAAGGSSSPQADPDVNVGLDAVLHRIAALHGELARSLEDLAERVGICLAGSAASSLMTTMPATPPSAPPEAEVPALMTPEELAALLHCCSRTLRRMELAGELPSPIKRGRLKRWRRTEIEEWLAARPSPRSGRRKPR